MYPFFRMREPGYAGSVSPTQAALREIGSLDQRIRESRNPITRWRLKAQRRRVIQTIAIRRIA